jgi:hypothetical protein
MFFPANKIERLRNPASYADSGQLCCQPTIYELSLSQEQPTKDQAPHAKPTGTGEEPLSAGVAIAMG